MSFNSTRPRPINFSSVITIDLLDTTEQFNMQPKSETAHTEKPNAF